MVSPRGRYKRRFEDKDEYENDKRGGRSDVLKSIRTGIKTERPTSAIPPKSDYKTKPGLR